jgi:hypothetical protein
MTKTRRRNYARLSGPVVLLNCRSCFSCQLALYFVPDW